jgi:hypothetical protein
MISVTPMIDSFLLYLYVDNRNKVLRSMRLKLSDILPFMSIPRRRINKSTLEALSFSRLSFQQHLLYGNDGSELDNVNDTSNQSNSNNTSSIALQGNSELPAFYMSWFDLQDPSVDASVIEASSSRSHAVTSRRLSLLDSTAMSPTKAVTTISGKEKLIPLMREEPRKDVPLTQFRLKIRIFEIISTAF